MRTCDVHLDSVLSSPPSTAAYGSANPARPFTSPEPRRRTLGSSPGSKKTADPEMCD